MRKLIVSGAVAAVVVVLSACGADSTRPDRDQPGGSGGAAAGGGGGAAGSTAGEGGAGGSGNASGSGATAGTGGAGNAGGSAGYGAAEQIDTLATGLNMPSEIEVDDTHAYWVDGYGNPSLGRVAKAGGALEELVLDTMAVDLALDDTHVYFTATGMDASVRRLPKSGGPPEVLAQDVGSPFGIALDGTWVYWTDASGGNAYRVAKTGGTPELLTSGLDDPWRIAIDDSTVFVAEVLTIASFPKDGGARTLVASPGKAGSYGPSEILVDDSWVYFGMSGFTPSGLTRMAKDGTGQESLYDKAVMDAAMDATHVYLGVWNAIGRADRGTGQTEIIAPQQPNVAGIAVDATHAYWTDVADGAVRRIAK